MFSVQPWKITIFVLCGVVFCANAQDPNKDVELITEKMNVVMEAPMRHEAQRAFYINDFYGPQLQVSNDNCVNILIGARQTIILIRLFVYLARPRVNMESISQSSGRLSRWSARSNHIQTTQSEQSGTDEYQCNGIDARQTCHSYSCVWGYRKGMQFNRTPFQTNSRKFSFFVLDLIEMTFLMCFSHTIPLIRLATLM